MEGFQACPSCYTEVDVVKVKHGDGEAGNDFFFVNCKECGKGTSEAYESVAELQEIWNAFVQQEKTAVFE